MAQDSWPSPDDNRTVNDADYERMAARWSDDGIYGTPADAPVVTAGAGLSVRIAANVFASLRGHSWTSGPTGDTLPVAANTSGTTRIDRVVLRLDRSTWQVRAVVKQGVPGAGVPTLWQTTGDTGSYEIAVAEAVVLNGASSVTVTRKELYVGTRIRPATSTTRNPLPVVGEQSYETDTGITRQWNGSTWRAILDDSGPIDVGVPLSAWSSNAQAILERKNGAVHLRLGSWTRAAGTLPATEDSRLPVLIPAAHQHPVRDQYGLAYVTGAQVARFIIYSAASDKPGQVWLTNKPAIAKGDSVLPVSGMSWVI